MGLSLSLAFIFHRLPAQLPCLCGSRGVNHSVLERALVGCLQFSHVLLDKEVPRTPLHSPPSPMSVMFLLLAAVALLGGSRADSHLNVYGQPLHLWEGATSSTAGGYPR